MQIDFDICAKERNGICGGPNDIYWYKYCYQSGLHESCLNLCNKHVNHYYGPSDGGNSVRYAADMRPLTHGGEGFRAHGICLFNGCGDVSNDCWYYVDY